MVQNSGLHLKGRLTVTVLLVESIIAYHWLSLHFMLFFLKHAGELRIFVLRGKPSFHAQPLYQ